MSFLSIAGALIRSIPGALADIKANEPLPPAPTMTLAEMAAAASAAETDIVGFNAAVVAHPGYVRAADRLLAALETCGLTWATKGRAFLRIAPGALATITADLPTVVSALKAFQPAPGWDTADGGGTAGYVPGPGAYRSR